MSKPVQQQTAVSNFVRPNTFTRDGGLKIKRYFSKKGVHPFDEVEWELRTAAITDENGKIIFEQKDVEIPKGWSPDGHQRRGLQIFPRRHGHRGARTQRQAAHPPRGQHHHRVGPRQGLLRHRGRRGDLPRRAPAPSGAPEDGLQLARSGSTWASKPGRSARPASSTPCQIVWNHPRPGQDRGHALQVRLGHRHQLLALALLQGEALRRRHGLRPGLLHEGLRLLRGRHQVGREAPAARPRWSSSTPTTRISWTSSRCKSEEEKKAWALIDAGYDGGFNGPAAPMFGLFQNANNSVRVTDDFMQAAEQRRHLGTPRPAKTARPWTPTRPGTAAHDRRIHLDLRRPGHAVRHHHQRLAHLLQHGPHQRLQPLQRVHVPRRFGLQPGVPEPHEVPQRRRRVRRRGLPARGGHHHPGAGNHRRLRQLPHPADRAQQPRLPAAGAGLRQPGRAAHVPGPGLRQRRGPRLRRRHHRAHAAARPISMSAQHRQGRGALRRALPATASPCCGSWQMHQADAAKIKRDGVPAELLIGRPGRLGRSRQPWQGMRLPQRARSPCWPPPAPSAS